VSVDRSSGCGKSTLLHIIACLVGDYEGQVAVAGSDRRAARRDRMVFQESRPFPRNGAGERRVSAEIAA